MRPTGKTRRGLTKARASIPSKPEMETTPKSESEVEPEKFPYEEGQICADVKIVEIKPEVERSIGFVYAKRGVIKDDRDKIVNTDGILQGQWQTEVQWMMVSDFKSFVKAQIESGQFVKGGT